MHVRFDELRGRKVIDANGRVIGRVRAAMVDMETWVVDSLRIAVSRQAAPDLDMRWSFWEALWRPPTIDIPTGQIHAAGDAILLRIAIGELREAVPHMTAQPAPIH
jgi:sporulation protein YlmC with PRC-barrel domain